MNSYPVRNCIVCNQQYKPTAGNQKCCGPQCFAQWGRIKHKKQYEQHKFSDKTSAVCVVCKAEFQYVFRKDRGARKFCGRSCASKFYIANGTFDEWRLRKNEIARVAVQCAACGNDIQVTPRVMIRYHDASMKHCCDAKCRQRYTAMINGSRPGHPFTEQMRENQRKTMIERHGVINAFMLAKRRITTRPQREIHEFMVNEFPTFDFQVEKQITSLADGREWYADIVSKTKKLIVEFYGDYWHCNPNKHKPDFMHQVKKMTAQEIWNADQDRLNSLLGCGYSVHVIWESEFRHPSQAWKETLKRWVNEAKNKDLDVVRSSVGNHSSADVKSGELLGIRDVGTTARLETANAMV